MFLFNLRKEGEPSRRRGEIMGRNSIGIEIEPAYCDIIRNRMAEIKKLGDIDAKQTFT